MEAQVAGKLGLKDASAKALAAAGSFKFDETNQRLFDDILMQRRQVCLCARACACCCRSAVPGTGKLAGAAMLAAPYAFVMPIASAFS